MKKFYIFLLLLLTTQAILAQSVLFKPGPVIGEDALVRKNNASACKSWETTNDGNATELSGMTWTYSANGCGVGTTRSLIRFTELSTIPAGSTIVYAELRLFGVNSSGNYGNSCFAGSPYFPNNNNEGWIRRVTSGWNETGTSGVTWTTQPTTTTTDEVATPVSTSRWGFDITADVTAQVQAMLSGTNNGFLFQLDDENIYRAILFASSDHADSTLWPELFVEYRLPCNADFSFCTSTGSPGTYKFTVDSVRAGYTYKWYFGDGSSASGTSVSHSYVNGGNYEVCLEVYNETGDKCRKCIKICVPELCSVSFDMDASHDPYHFFFNAITDGSPVASYHWDFGDGATSSTGPNTDHKYSKAGYYVVCLTVTYENGCIARYCIRVNAGDPIIIIGGGDPPGEGGKAIPANAKAEAASIKTIAAIKVIPNPVNTRSITVSMSDVAGGTYSYKIFNTKGEVAITGTSSLGKGMQSTELDVKNLKPGKYWIEFSNSRQQLRTAFIKL